jgi:hypothetical protein
LYLKANHSPTEVTSGQIVTERNVSLSVNGELDNYHCDDLLPVDEKGRLGTFEEKKG